MLATPTAHATSQLERLKWQNEHFARDFLHFSRFEAENRRFPASFSYKAILQSSKSMIFAMRHFSSNSRNAVPAATFDTVSCLRSPDTAIHQNIHRDKSQNAAPATKLQNAHAQRGFVLQC